MAATKERAGLDPNARGAKIPLDATANTTPKEQGAYNTKPGMPAMWFIAAPFAAVVLTVLLAVITR